jgi:F-type H+-transporting ATPase subunit epsilon
MLQVDIVTPAKVIYSGLAESVTVPGSKSPFQILNNHAPIVSSLDDGIVKVVTDTHQELVYKTSSGFVELQHNKISVLVESAVAE